MEKDYTYFICAACLKKEKQQHKRSPYSKAEVVRSKVILMINFQAQHHTESSSNLKIITNLKTKTSK